MLLIVCFRQQIFPGSHPLQQQGIDLLAVVDAVPVVVQIGVFLYLNCNTVGANFWLLPIIFCMKS